MGNICRNCGAPIAPGANNCGECGYIVAPVQQPAQQPAQVNISVNGNGWALAGCVLAAVVALLCIITAFMDSSNFINRLYTTALMWQLPLVAIALTAYGFKKSGQGESKVVGWISVLLLTAAFFCSNITKNSVQDVVSNVDNYVDVAAEAVPEIMKNGEKWGEKLQNATKRVDFSDFDDDYDDYDEEYW